MRKSKSIAGFWLCAVLVNSIFITGCSSESTNTRKAVTLKWNQETEETDSEAESLEEAGAYNLEILEKMKELYENGELLDAVKAAQDMDRRGDYSPEIAALRNQIIRENREFFEAQIDPAFENGDLYMIEALLNYFELDKERKKEYDFVKRLQGEYASLDKPDGEICVIINGYEIQENGRKSRFTYKEVKPIDHVDYYENRLFLDDGSEVEEVNVGLIAITRKNGTIKKYITDEGKKNLERIEEKNRKKSESEAQKEKEYPANEPRIGMTKGEVLNSDWGRPTKINKTTYEWGVSEQWVYPGDKYIYIEEDVVISITE